MDTVRIDTHHIADNAWYNAEMAKSLIDKIFFLDKTDATLFVDFGCADGTLLAFIAKVFPGVTLVGYDVNREMIDRARELHAGSGIVFTDDWNEVVRIEAEHRAKGEKSCVVCNSLTHEIESYLDGDEKTAAYDKIWGRGGIRFHYVALRDMMVSRSASRPSDPFQVARIQQIFEALHPGLLSQWTARWGTLSENWSLVHFLLTYRYTNSWEREHRENYLPVNLEDFMASVPRGYIAVYRDHFTLPFLRRQVQKDFDITISDPTHLKVVFELL